jgi:Glycosyl hydrolases family 39
MDVHWSEGAPVCTAKVATQTRRQPGVEVKIFGFQALRAFWLLFILISWWPATTFAESACALPLNRFPVSRHAQDNAAGFYHMPAGVADDYFDGTSPVSRVKRHLKVARKVGAKYLRCAFSWNGIEPEQGKFRWQFWDNLVRLAEQNRIELIPYVAYTPRWAARKGKDFWKQPPRDPKLYADFMFQIATRYRGRIRSWEIWNEPDNKDYWTGTPDEYAELTMLAAKRIREADPQAVLVLGGVAYGPNKFLQTLITGYHLDRYVDVIAMHAYPESWLNIPMETIFEQWVPEIAQLIAGDGSGDDLWLNEMGYPDYRYRPNQASLYGGMVNYRYEHTRGYQAMMLFKMEVMALGSDQVSLTGWYRIDDFPLNEKRLGADLVNYHLGLEDGLADRSPRSSH